mmetsp:Transcript_113913/g.159776  ORF Transcript_113913/g.159776 Transcript_113913/m.159776 type:complete len:805 (+) Transcript_113913:312-2726(+)
MRNTVFNLKRLIGRKFSSPEVQAELPSLPFKLVQVGGPDVDDVGVEVTFRGEQQVFSVEQLVAMLFTQMTKITELESKVKAKDIVITVPGYFSDQERRAVGASAEIAGLNCLQLLPEPIAVGISYAIYKKDLPKEEEAQITMFVDVGQSATSVFIAAVSLGKFRVLSAVYDRSLGGRDYDQALASHFVEQIKEKYKMDVSDNHKAMKRLRDACERVKKVFTTNPQTVLNAESLMNDVDVRSPIERTDFDEMTKPLSERVAALVSQAIEQSGINPTALTSVELLGGASRIVSVQKAVTSQVQCEVRNTLNKSECIARGAAIQCAILSPQFHVNRDWVAKGVLPYTVKTQWTIEKGVEVADADGTAEEKAEAPSVLQFDKGSSTPTARKITFVNAKKVEIEATYPNVEELPKGVPAMIGLFRIQNNQKNEDGTLPKIELKLRIGPDGLLGVGYATALVKYTEVVQPKVEEKKPAAEAATAEKPADAAAADKPAADGDVEMTDAPAAAEEAKPAEATEAPAAAEPIVKKKVKRVSLAVEAFYHGGVPAPVVAELLKKELDMRRVDEELRVTAEARNALESFVYDFRSRIQWEGTELHEFAAEEEHSALLAKLQEAEDWIYGDGEDAKKEEYESRLSALKAACSPVELRKNEAETRPGAVEELTKTLAEFTKWLQDTDEKYAHIGEEPRKKVEDELFKAQDWLNTKQEKQVSLPKTANPVLLTDELRNKAAQLRKVCQTVKDTPKPAPPKEEPKEEAKADAAPEAAKDAPKEGAAAQAPEPMDVDSSASAPSEEQAAAAAAAAADELD